MEFINIQIDTTICNSRTVEIEFFFFFGNRENSGIKKNIFQLFQ